MTIQPVGNDLSVYFQTSNNSKISNTSESNTTAQTGRDTVDFSQAGLLLSIKESLGLELWEPITIESIEASITKDKSSVDDFLSQTMDKLGIDKNVTFELKTGFSGQIIVKGDFQGKEELENMLNANREFSNTFRRMSANSSLIEACRRHEEFMKAYEIDPEAAVSQFMYLFNDNSGYEFSYVYENGETTTRVDFVSNYGMN